MTLSGVLDLLYNHLKAAIESDSDFTRFGGAQVVKLTEEPLVSQHAGVPCILLSATDEPEPKWGRGTRRASVAATCKASDFAGAVHGTANPETAHDMLSRKLQGIIEDDYSALMAAGLYDIKIKVGRNTRTAETGEAPAYSQIEHTITFVYFE